MPPTGCYWFDPPTPPIPFEVPFWFILSIENFVFSNPYPLSIANNPSLGWLWMFSGLTIFNVILWKLDVRQLAIVIKWKLYFVCLLLLHTQVKHFLQHTFGIPYAENYYAGDWMLGPDLFCWQPICSLGYSINAYAHHVKPKTYDDVQDVVDTIMKHKTPIDRYRYGQCSYIVPILGVVGEGLQLLSEEIFCTVCLVVSHRNICMSNNQ